MMTEHNPATPAQRVGIFLAFVEACLLGVMAALHFGWKWDLGGETFAAPLLFPAAIVEAVLAVALLLGIILPGAGNVRSGRVLAAQILVVIGVFVGQIALLRDVALSTSRSEIVYGSLVALALASIALISSPAFRRGDQASVHR